MLKALYDYARQHELILPAGCVKKTIKAFVHLSAEGKFQFVEPVDNLELVAPDIGSLANGKDKSNVIVEKRAVVVPEQATAKSSFFLTALEEGGQEEPMLDVCCRALKDERTAAEIRDALDSCNIKPGERITFKVDSRSVLDSPNTIEWWNRWRAQFQKTEGREQTMCLITGAPVIPAVTTAPINGLHIVGGHARGDALICFDKNAFCSYGLKKAANAPVSEEAFAAVKAALDDLLSDAPVLAGMKFVHWYDTDLTKEEDPIRNSLDFGYFDDEEDEEETLSENETRLEQMERENDARQRADAVVRSVTTGKQAEALNDVTYYILLLTGVGGRVMIRRYERGNYQELQRKIDQWHQDLRLTNAQGTGNIRSCKLVFRLLRLINWNSEDKKSVKYLSVDQKKRLNKELSGITPAILTAILTGSALPDYVAARALTSIRSQLMDEGNNEINRRTVGYVYQWLKVWLLRKHRLQGQEETIMESYNLSHPSPAYHCGGQMAVYAAIQRAAMPDVNVSVVQRYFASAMQTPALVMGQLSHRSIHHLGKIENRWLADYFQKKLQELSVAAGFEIPVTLTLEEQSYFALGYYQMGALLEQERKEKTEQKAQNRESDQEG
jgi:CRISPR-associated protein Csd1